MVATPVQCARNPSLPPESLPTLTDDKHVGFRWWRILLLWSRGGGACPDMLFRLHEFSHRHRAAERRGSRSPDTHGSGSFPPSLRSASGRLGLGRSALPASASRFEKTQPRIRGSAVGIVVATSGARRVQGAEYHSREVVSVGWVRYYRVLCCDGALRDLPGR